MANFIGPYGQSGRPGMTSAVFHRHLHSRYPVAAGGDGMYLIDDQGNRYLDASGGAAVSCLGHGDNAVIAAITAQAENIAYAHTGFFTSEPAEALADRLVRDAPEGLTKVFYVSGGSEAMDSALKLARQYFVEKGEPGRRRFIARRQSFHGNTLGALAVGGNQWRRAQFEPLLIDADHISPCFAYREQRQDEDEEAFGVRVADELEQAILARGPGTVAAFLAETVVGATAGAVPPVKGYFKRIREICDKYGVLLILDEVMCGMGRTGTLHACEQENIVPDLLTIAKGLGAGYQPIGAVLISGVIHNAIRDGSGFFQHSHTFMGHPVACAAGLAVLDAIEQRALLANVRRQGKNLGQRLAARFGNHPHVGDIRGRGLFYGVELVADRGTKAPFDPAAALNVRVKKAAMEHGLICYPMGGTIDGNRGDHILLAPPFIVAESHLEEIVERLAESVDTAIASLG